MKKYSSMLSAVVVTGALRVMHLRVNRSAIHKFNIYHDGIFSAFQLIFQHRWKSAAVKGNMTI